MQNQIYIYHINGKPYSLLMNQILYFESRGRKVAIITENGETEYYDTLSNIEQTLSPYDFVRCHQSYIINIHKVSGYTSKKLMIENETLSITRKYKDQVMLAFANAQHSYGTLSCTKGALKGAHYLLKTNESIALGRDADVCDICIPLPEVSRIHCILLYDNISKQYFIKDQSKNGTYLLNGTRLPTREWVRLDPGQGIFLGKAALEYTCL